MDTGDRFAGLLKGLKERSGLSYGALAKRLHVSTSTLHRYCNGDAVPTDFAPVERLGRLCGATREELVALHRAWIVADENRGRSGEPVVEPVTPLAEPAVGSEEPVEPLVVVTPEAVEQGAAPTRGRFRSGLAAVAVVALVVPGAYLVVARDGEKEPRGGAVAAPAPLNAGVSSYNWAAPCGQYYVLDQKPEHVPPPPPPQDTRPWARALGGVDGGHMQLQVTVTGRTQEPVVLSRLGVRVVERGRPPERAAYSMGDGCGSGVTPQTFDVDLDAPRPYVKAVAGQDGDRVVPAKDFPYKVATGDPQVLNLDVHTEEHAVAWYLELEWSTGDRKGTVRIDDGGQPFRTQAVEGRTVYGYWPDKGEWVAQQ
ncbi:MULTISPECIES: helix-turn-helix domain-containing protein [Streptomyces]|uniref:Helix-turn-helix transcriptional regulator n=2 Tax=Streptomyces TaxID=1883 RepID=A0ABU4K2K5_9ACTN|nr:helix-turn-helix transcriptional regulator [Streptomyces roseolus]MDX2291978.1 helix-turn-helix transcriptional regulator [Streptomyces roseolus]